MKLDVYQMLIKCNVFQMIHSLTNVLEVFVCLLVMVLKMFIVSSQEHVQVCIKCK